MKLVVTITVLIAVASVARAQGGSQAPSGDAKAEQEVRIFQSELFGAMGRRDRAALERLLADGFVFVHSTGGIETRKEFIDNAAAGVLSSQTADPQFLDMQLRVYEGHIAIRVSRSVRDKGRPGEVNLRTVHAYAKLNGRWQWLSGQSTKLPTRPKGAAVSSRHYDDYVGRYVISEGRTFDVTKEGETLRGQATGRPQVELIPRSEAEFIWFNPESNVDAQIIFIRDEGGRVTHAVFRREGHEVWRAKRLK